MLNLFGTTKKMKGYKVTDNARTKKYGIGANSLKLLLDKAKLKFPLPEDFKKFMFSLNLIKDCHIYLSTDGFEVSDEDYFQSLEPQTLFIIAGPDEIITTDSDFEYEKLRQRSPLLKVADIIYEFIERNPDKFKRMICEYEKKKPQIDIEKTHLSLRSEHSEWFEGQEERCNSKEEAMSRRAQDRIRSYYYKTKDELTRNKLYRSNAKARLVLDRILEKFRYLLIGCDYFSMIFDRSCVKKHEFLKNDNDDDDDETDARPLPNKRLKQIIKEYTTKNELLDEWSVSLCSDLGDFYCQGPYSENQPCNKDHCINPYASRENLILFQVWNLDHQIELSRTILPSLIQNVRDLVENPNQKCPIHKKRVVDISVLEYFLEIFSLKNLKLVHIVCHEKVQRSNVSNGRLICENCHEYKIVKELLDVSCPEEVDAC